MPLYKIDGTPIQFTVADEAAEAFNRIDLMIIKRTLEDSSLPLKEIVITVTLDDLFKWKKVTALIEDLRGLNGNFINQFNGEIDDPRLVLV